MGRALHAVVVGAGAAGSAAAMALRKGADAAGTLMAVTVIGAEERMPYNRTTVNKGLLAGAVDDTGIALPGIDNVGVDWRTGSVVEALDARHRVLQLRDGAGLQADAVVLATGATPRPLPAPVEDAARDRVLQLRTAADTHRLRGLLDRADGSSRRVVVAGAGLIGTEAAAVLQEMGCEVTLVDPSPQPMTRHVGRTVATWVAAAHRAAGVDLRLQTRLTSVRVDPSGLLVDLSDGHSVSAAAVVACLGVDPATAWLTGSGLPTRVDGTRPDGGVVVDADQRVPDFPGIYAAGDLAAIPGPDESPVRVEHWGAALEQGRIAAASALADLGVHAPANGDSPARAVPSYSTYVHTTKLTILGWQLAAVAERPILGSPGDPRFALALLDTADRVVAAVGVGGARAANALLPLIERRASASDIRSTRSTSQVSPSQGPSASQHDVAASGR